MAKHHPQMIPSTCGKNTAWHYAVLFILRLFLPAAWRVEGVRGREGEMERGREGAEDGD
jgi:hypothetical protein